MPLAALMAGILYAIFWVTIRLIVAIVHAVVLVVSARRRAVQLTKTRGLDRDRS